MSNDNPPADHIIPENGDSGITIEENIKSRSTWLRLLFIFAFYVIGTVVTAVLSLVVILGFCWVLFTGEKNDQLQQAGQAIADYLYEIIRYLTFNSEEKPFPFGNDWPSAGIKD